MGHRVPSCEGTSSAKAMPAVLIVWKNRRPTSLACPGHSLCWTGYRFKLLVLMNLNPQISADYRARINPLKSAEKCAERKNHEKAFHNNEL
jgi:hypothetical protein